MRNILRFNPEFARNLWQEFNMQRIILMPLIIGLIVILIITFEGFNQEAASTIHSFSLVIFLAVTSIWGIRSASGALLEEQQGQTWDWQRLSGLQPWKLTIGKLFGGTSYNWYGGLICLVLFVVTTPGDGWETEIAKIMTAVFFTITIHALVMLFTLPQMSKPYSGRSKLRGFMVYSAVAGLIIYVWVYSQLESREDFNLNWYGIDAHYAVLALFTSVFYCTWTIAGLYRTMRAELQYADAPTWWLAFLISNLIFQFGFLIKWQGIPEGNKWMIMMMIAMIEYLSATYIISFSDQRDIIAWRELLYPRNRWIWFKELPLWMISLTFALIAGIALATINATTENTVWSITEIIFHEKPIYVFMFIVSLFGFVVRDMGIMMLLKFSLKRDKASTYTILYMVILYGLLPAFAGLVGLGMMFYPDITANPALMPVFPLVEAIVIVFLVVRKIRGSVEHTRILPG